MSIGWALSQDGSAVEAAIASVRIEAAQQPEPPLLSAMVRWLMKSVTHAQRSVQLAAASYKWLTPIQHCCR